jgi:hypothetical protein
MTPVGLMWQGNVDQVQARPRPELAEDVRDMRARRLDADVQLLRDLGIRFTSTEQGQDLALATRERCDAPGASRRGSEMRLALDRRQSRRLSATRGAVNRPEDLRTGRVERQTRRDSTIQQKRARARGFPGEHDDPEARPHGPQARERGATGDDGVADHRDVRGRLGSGALELASIEIVADNPQAAVFAKNPPQAVTYERPESTHDNADRQIGSGHRADQRRGDLSPTSRSEASASRGSHSVARLQLVVRHTKSIACSSSVPPAEREARPPEAAFSRLKLDRR